MNPARYVRNYHRHISTHVLKETPMDRLIYVAESVLYRVLRRVMGLHS